MIFEYALEILFVGMISYVALCLITPADEKTHGFNRVDDSPQIT